MISELDDLARIFRPRRQGSRALVFAGHALGALAIGAAAVGAVAIGALAIGRLAVGRASIRRLEIEELVVRKLRVVEELQVPRDAPSSATGVGEGE